MSAETNLTLLERLARRPSWRSLDWLVTALVFGIALVVCVIQVDWKAHPREDAAMLMRYAGHLAAGHGIVWNIGEKPVDGATDFLFMVIVAGARRLGMPLELAVRWLNIVPHAATVALIYATAVRIVGAPRAVGLFLAALVVLGPAHLYTTGGFGTACYAGFGAAAWAAALAVAERPSHVRSAAFALLALTAGLIRPDGVILAVMMGLALWYRLGKKAWTPFLWFLVVFSVLGGAYFVWRWTYFGHPLPNPFYVKGGGQVHLAGLMTSYHGVRALLKVCLPLVVLALVGWHSMRMAIFGAIPVIGFTVAWILLSDEMNFFFRFQYVLLPIGLLSFAVLIRAALDDGRDILKFFAARGQSLLITALIFVFAARAMAVHWRHWRADESMKATESDGRYDVAMILRDYADRDYTMAITEAGLLPLYSTWRAIDTWGLNDASIAHHGGVTEEYLDQHQPHVVMINSSVDRASHPGYMLPKWFEMTLKVFDYVERRNYTLAAVYLQTPDAPFAHYYFVRNDFPESAEMQQRIRALDNYGDPPWTRRSELPPRMKR